MSKWVRTLRQWASIVLTLGIALSASAQNQAVRLQFENQKGEPVQLRLWVEPAGMFLSTDKKGRLSISQKDRYRSATTYAPGYSTKEFSIQKLNGSKIHRFVLAPLHRRLRTVEVRGGRNELFDLQAMRKIEGTAVFAARRAEKLSLRQALKTASASQARQVLGSIAGLHLWENNDQGLQLNIGTRGLSPNRSAHLNSRQNGYDISADALGYPESYYTPPMHAVERIELVRGAGSLQYGTQFGGLLNFKMKEGMYDTPLEYQSVQTGGSFGLLESYHAFTGGTETLKYYTSYQYKRSDGWRSNSGYDRHNAFAAISWRLSEKIEIGVDYTFMDYTAQMPGGLTDEAFRGAPSQSVRSRNYFRVQWHLAALKANMRPGDRSRIDFRLFSLNAEREALGVLEAIHRPDPLRERELISGEYDNLGLEARYRYRYAVGDLPSNIVVGLRLYRGKTKAIQGFADAGSDPDFELLHPESPEQYRYQYPGENAALFVENVLNLAEHFTLTAGMRWEYIETSADGYYRENIFIADSLVYFQKYPDVQNNIRRFPLFGAGLSYSTESKLEWYGNFTQNFRSVNFSDLTASNPNIAIDSTLEDERGFSLEAGLRGRGDRGTQFDLTLFWLSYRQRIGLVNRRIDDPVFGQRAVAYRTNVGHARILGWEGNWQQRWIGANAAEHWVLSSTLTAQLIHGRYIDGVRAVSGNEVESVPPYSCTLRMEARRNRWRFGVQFKRVGGHFSDATNAERAVHATVGKIPAYQILDASVHYEREKFKLSLFVNNVLNEQYFTRRATAYPGPGIIPASPRNISLRLQFNLGGGNGARE